MKRADVETKPARARRGLVLGTINQASNAGALRLEGAALESHKHLIGLTGSGKSKLIESAFLQLLFQKVGVSLIDPHRDLARDILGYLQMSGFFEDERAYERLIYIDFSSDRHVPFNVLKSRLAPADAGYAFLDALKRAWPSISGGTAPQLENLVLASTTALAETGLPVTELPRFLADSEYRHSVLQGVSDIEVRHFFATRYGKSDRSDNQMSESTLRRIFLLSFAPALRYCLGDSENVLDFRRFMDESRAVIFDLGGVQNPEARKLLGCLITVGYENAALSRVEDSGHRPQHHLIVDEFADFVSQSEEAMTKILAQCRKYGLHLTLAHQTWSQASRGLRGALQNAGVEIVFRLGRSDAEDTAKAIGAVKPNLTDPRTGRVMSFATQWELWNQDIQSLPPREAFVKIGQRATERIKTLDVSSTRANSGDISTVLQRYSQIYLRMSRVKESNGDAPKRSMPDVTPPRLWQRKDSDVPAW